MTQSEHMLAVVKYFHLAESGLDIAVEPGSSPRQSFDSDADRDSDSRLPYPLFRTPYSLALDPYSASAVMKSASCAGAVLSGSGSRRPLDVR